MIDQVSAMDEMRRFFFDRWNVATPPAGLDEMPPVRWKGKAEAALPPDFYAYFGAQVKTTAQSAHMTNEDGGSNPIYDTAGIVGIAIYAAMTAQDASHIAALLAQLARDIFRSGETDGGVWFRNATSTELENDGKSYRFLVTVNFLFSEI